MKTNEFKQMLVRINFIANKVAKRLDEKSTEVDIDFDSNPESILCHYEISHCGCCSGDYKHFIIFYEALENDNDEEIIDMLVKQREKEKAFFEEVTRLNKEKEATEQEERRYKSYLILKEKYENK